MKLVRVIDKRKPFLRLIRVGETDSKMTWIFTFSDPVHKFVQSIILSKTDDAGEKMEEMVEKLYMQWQERINADEFNLIFGRANDN